MHSSSLAFVFFLLLVVRESSALGETESERTEINDVETSRTVATESQGSTVAGTTEIMHRANTVTLDNNAGLTPVNNSEELESNSEELEITTESVETGQEKKDVVIKLFIVADYTIFKRWLEVSEFNATKARENLRMYVTNLVKTAEVPFKHLTRTRLRFSLKIVKIHIVETRLESNFTILASPWGFFNQLDVLEPFQKWLFSTYSEFPSSADIAIVMSKLNVWTTGYYKAVCSNGTASLKDGGFVETAMNLAGVVATNLGAGLERNCSNQISVYRNSGTNQMANFSVCSETDMTANIIRLQSLNSSCLDNETLDESHEVPASYTESSQLANFTEDQQCLYHTGFRACHYLDMYRDRPFNLTTCTRLRCVERESCTTLDIPPWEGSTCRSYEGDDDNE